MDYSAPLFSISDISNAENVHTRYRYDRKKPLFNMVKSSVWHRLERKLQVVIATQDPISNILDLFIKLQEDENNLIFREIIKTMASISDVRCHGYQ